jgi:hypothetical protein
MGLVAQVAEFFLDPFLVRLNPLTLAFVHDGRISITRGLALFLPPVVLVSVDIGLRMRAVDDLRRTHLQTQASGRRCSPEAPSGPLGGIDVTRFAGIMITSERKIAIPLSSSTLRPKANRRSIFNTRA